MTERLVLLKDKVEAALCFIQPKLAISTAGRLVIVEGKFLVSPRHSDHDDYGAIAEYEIRVEIDPDYPRVEPKVFETAGAFPHSEEHHAYDLGQCCVLIWEIWTAESPDTSILAYFEGPLRNFFLSQYLVLSGKEWPFGEWQHGQDGLAQAFSQRLGCKPDVRTVRKFLHSYIKILNRRSLPLYWKCPCQSGLNLKNWCCDLIQNLMGRINFDQATAMLHRLTHPTRTVGAVSK